MASILAQFAENIRKSGVTKLPPDHPLISLEIILHDLIVLHKERLQPSYRSQNG